jgi:PAS domain S-box-containing protein
MAGSNRKSGIHATKVIDVVNNHRFAPIQRSDKWQLMGSAERKLAEERYRTLFEQNPEGGVIIDEKMEVLLANQAAATMFGFDSAEEVRGANPFDFIPPEERERALRALAKDMFEHNLRQVNEFRLITKTGEEIWISAVGTLIEYQGKPAGLVSFRDITGRKRMEEALKKSEEKYRNLLNNIKLGILRSTPAGRILEVNPAMEEITGYSRQELLEMDIRKMYVHLEEREAIVEELALTRGKVVRELRWWKKDGTEMVVLATVVAVRDDTGKILYFDAIIEDVTERKRAEEALRKAHDELEMRVEERTAELTKANEELRIEITERKRMEEALRESEKKYSTLVEQSNDGIAIIQDGLIRFANPKILKIYGLTAGETLGKPFLDFVSPEYRDLVVDRYKKRMSGEKTPNIYELEILAKDGSKIPLEINASRIEYQGSPADMVIVRDITDRKRMELEYKTILQTTVDGFWLTDVQGRFLDVNDAYCRLVGYNRDELLKMSIPDVEAIEKPEEIAARIAKVRKVGGDRFETHHRRKDGTIVDVEVSVNYIELAGGRMCVFVRDITDRKRMGEALKESEEKYRSLVNDISLGIFRSTPGPRGRFLEVNPAMEQITGYSRQELLQIDVCDLYQHPEERQQCLEEIASAAGMTTRETRFRKKDGTEIVVSDTKVAIRDDAGQIIYFDGILEDITERKKSEEQIKRAAEEWRTTFDSITDWVSIVDKDFKLVRVNKAFADAFGKKPGELIGKTCYQVVHKTNEPVRDCPRRKTLRTKRPAAVEFFEPSLEMYLEARTSPIFNEKDEVVACIEVTTDVTERKRMQEQLMLTHRLASLGELVSGVAHELNNPLTSVIGFSQLLMEGEIADDIREDLSLVYSEAQRAAGIVENLLTFARKHAPAKQLTRINNVIEDVLKLRAYWQRVNNIEVRRQFASDLPEIMVDFVQMQQVFLNIIINAEYFMIQAHNRGTLTTTTKKVGDVVRISFADDGPGIAKENLTRIFDPFFTTKEVGVGTGLGLSICHGIVTAHGGRIYARSQVGEGATFVVELPINSP